MNTTSTTPARKPVRRKPKLTPATFGLTDDSYAWIEDNIGLDLKGIQEMSEEERDKFLPIWVGLYDNSAKFAQATSSGLATVPKGYLATYIHRTLDGGINDFDLLRGAFEDHENVLIEGPTGPGKTHAAMAFAESLGLPFYAVSSNVNIDMTHLFGKYVPDENEMGKWIWVDGPVTELVRCGGVLLVNEVNFLPEKFSTILFELLDLRRSIKLSDHHGEVVVAHPKFFLMADMNPGYEGTRPLNKAFRNRFAHQIVWDYDPNVERQLLRCPSLLRLADDLRSRYKERKLSTPTTTNSLMELERHADRYGIEYAMQNFSNHYAETDRAAVLTVAKTYKEDILQELFPADLTTEWDALR